jgi:hypothetical protein
MLRSVRAEAAEQLAGTLQPLDPREQRDQALAICERLEQSLGVLRHRFAAPQLSVPDVAVPRRSGSRPPQF